MSEPIPLLLLYAFMVLTGKPLPSILKYYSTTANVLTVSREVYSRRKTSNHIQLCKCFLIAGQKIIT
jgi:hypothetical protein